MVKSSLTTYTDVVNVIATVHVDDGLDPYPYFHKIDHQLVTVEDDVNVHWNVAAIDVNSPETNVMNTIANVTLNANFAT